MYGIVPLLAPEIHLSALFQIRAYFKYVVLSRHIPEQGKPPACLYAFGFSVVVGFFCLFFVSEPSACLPFCTLVMYKTCS